MRAHLSTVILTSGETIDFPASGVTVLVGGNNAGKSTFLRQLHQFLHSGNAGLAGMVPPLIASGSLKREQSPADLIHWLGENTAYVDRDASQGGPYFSTPGMTIEVRHVVDGAFGQHYDSLQDLHVLLVSFADATSRLNTQFSVSGRSSVDEPATTPLHRFQDNRALFGKLNDLSRQVFDQSLLLDDFPGGTVQIRVGQVDLPVPRRDEPLGEFGRQVGKLPPLAEQGDGMRSFFGLVIPLVAESKKILLVDEPEAFLHPPQARALGRELSRTATDRGIQVIVATHDKDFIAGLLDSDADLTVVRLLRSKSGTRRAQLPSEKLREVWDDRQLRYSNVLDGLFAQLVVICESDQDCRFYEAALDHYVLAHSENPDVHTIPSSEVLFLPSNGKAGFVNLIGVLRDLAVPTVVVPDLDVLRDESLIDPLFTALNGDWDNVKTLFTVATEGLKRPAQARTVKSVLDTIEAILRPTADANPSAAYTTEIKRLVTDQVNSTSDPWASAKRSGVAAFKGDQRSALNELLDAFDARGLILVRVGELEGFAPDLAKNREWLPGAIAAGAFAKAEAQEHVRRILEFHAQTASVAAIE